jgi:DNA processing protein
VSATLPDLAYLAALAALPEMWPTRLAALLGVSRAEAAPPRRAAAGVWHDLLEGRPVNESWCRGDPQPIVAGWRHAAAAADPTAIWRGYRSAGVRLLVLGEPGYPDCLRADVRPPYFLYARGNVAAVDGPRAAIIGTRRCSPSGREIAAQFGRELAAAGARVVSGLALGIDGAAHAGALAAADGAPPIGVVAGGLDRPYPVRHRHLWDEVAAAGLLLSEAPLGTPNEAWRFPARNRIIAALADVVVVIESHAGGGSMITADEALARGRTVLAVPGPIRSPASAGTNSLLRDGAGPACDVADVLAALSLHHAAPRQAEVPAPPEPELAPILEAVDWSATSIEQVMLRTGQPPGVVAAALARLEMGGWISGSGGWWQRTDARGNAGEARTVGA